MKKKLILHSLIIPLFCLGSASATSLLPLSLEQLSTRASLIFYGQVISNQVKQDTQSGYIATFTEFKVLDLIKGKAGDSHTIKQIGGELNSQNTALRIHGVPKFSHGKNYVVFLPAASKLGFSSPLGLHQGSFSVTTVNNEQIVGNGRMLTDQAIAAPNNKNIQLPLAVTAGKPSQARLDDFINTVRAYNSY